MESTKLLEVENLRINIAGKNELQPLVWDLDFSINKNETLGIVGESGSGKSLTSLSIMGLLNRNLKATASKAIFHNPHSSVKTDLFSISEQEMRKIRGKEIAMIFQEPMTALNPAYTCGNQITEVVKLHLQKNGGQAKAHAIDWLERVKITNAEKAYQAYPHQLSGGQRQRVMIAMAMCCNPHLLIADEPTTALDVTVQKSILELMKELQNEFGTGIIFITHDLGVIHEVSDNLLVMNAGKLVEKGKTEKVLSKPEQSYTKGLMACRPPLKGKLKRLPVMQDFLGKEQGESKSDAEIQQFLKELRETGPSENSTSRSEQPILRAVHMEVNYPIETNFWGKPKLYFNALKKVSLSLFKGETLGLVGESGCGKTTLGRSILHLLENASGEIYLKGRQVDFSDQADRRSFRRSVQLVFQDPYSSLNPSMTIGAAVMEPLLVQNPHGLSRKEIEQKCLHLLDRVGIPKTAFNRYPHEFSGGQRQRIGVARAISLEPEILICDESVSALDMSVQAQVLNLLNELKRDLGLTYLFISHDLSVVRYMSDRLLVMKDGAIEEEGWSEEIYEHPKSAYTKQLIASLPQIDESIP